MINLFSFYLERVCAHNCIDLSYIPFVYRDDQVLNGPRLCSHTLLEEPFTPPIILAAHISAFLSIAFWGEKARALYSLQCVTHQGFTLSHFIFFLLYLHYFLYLFRSRSQTSKVLGFCGSWCVIFNKFSAIVALQSKKRTNGNCLV